MTVLDGKVVIVSGAGPGLGGAVAHAAARDGAAVVCAARSADKLDELVDLITGSGGTATGVPTDVSDRAQCEALVAATIDAYGRLDGLVNSAFRPDLGGPFATADLGTWRKLMKVNFWGAMELTQAALEPLRADDGGSIVNIGSMSTRKPLPGQGGYVASKSALLGATRALAVELGAHNVRVNAVLPSWMWGPNVRTHVAWRVESEGLDEDEVIAGITEHIPLGEITPQEGVADAVVYLLSDRARYITGQRLDVNGGEFMD